MNFNAFPYLKVDTEKAESENNAKAQAFQPSFFQAKMMSRSERTSSALAAEVELLHHLCISQWDDTRLSKSTFCFLRLHQATECH